MDGVSAAASILAIAGAGFQISVKLVSLATQIKTAPDRVTSIGNDVTLVSNLLKQLGDLMDEKSSHGSTSIFNQAGLETTIHSANMCHRIFDDLQSEVHKSSAQLRQSGKPLGQKFKLSAMEKARWPFLQPKIELLRQDLQEAKSTLMLMLQVTTLAFSKRVAQTAPSQGVAMFDMDNLVRTIVAIQQEKRPIKNQSYLSNDEHRFNEKLSENNVNANDPNLRRPPHDNHNTSGAAKYWGPKSHIKIPRVDNPQTFDHGTGHNESESSKGIDLSDAGSQLDDFSTKSTLIGNVPPANDRTASMILLKPVLQDHWDKVELTWRKQNVKLSANEQAQYNFQGSNALDEVLEGLHSYERSIIDDELYDCGSTSQVVSIKRTKTDIPARNTTLKELPGLQFVIQADRPVDNSPTAIFLNRPPRSVKRASPHRRSHGHVSLFDLSDEVLLRRRSRVRLLGSSDEEVLPKLPEKKAKKDKKKAKGQAQESLEHSPQLEMELLNKEKNQRPEDEIREREAAEAYYERELREELEQDQSARKLDAMPTHPLAKFLKFQLPAGAEEDTDSLYRWTSEESSPEDVDHRIIRPRRVHPERSARSTSPIRRHTARSPSPSPISPGHAEAPIVPCWSPSSSPANSNVGSRGFSRSDEQSGRELDDRQGRLLQEPLDDSEAAKMVDDLLEKYTTLYG